MNLFKSGFFTLHSGKHSTFKIDCDALTDADLETIAHLLVRRLPPEGFSSVEGVPTGGLRLAAALRRYARPFAPLLVADDVYSTGASMERQRAERPALGVVIFARCPVTQNWITPLFVMTSDLDEG